LLLALVVPSAATAANTNATGVIVSLVPATRTVTIRKSGDGTQVMLRAVDRSELSRNGKSVRFAALALRDQVSVRYQRSSSTIVSLDARGPALETTRGVFTSFDATAKRLTMATVGGTRSFHINASTLIVRNGAPSTAQGLVHGDALLVHAPAVAAVAVALAFDVAADGVEEEEIEGTITTLAGQDVTITPQSGSAVTVHVSNTTVIKVTDAGGTHTATLAALATGMKAEADYDPVSLVADHINARAAAQARQGEVEGKVLAVDATARTVTIDAKHGADVTLHVDSTTRISRNGAPATLADIRVGDSAEARYDTTSLLASRLEARSETPQPYAQVEGIVTDVDDASVTIKPQSKSAVTLTVDDTTEVFLRGTPATLAVVQVGQRAHASYDGATLVAVVVRVQNGD
jgi:hypothetical protein